MRLFKIVITHKLTLKNINFCQMKNILFIAIVLLLFSCAKEDEKSGTLQTYPIVEYRAYYNTNDGWWEMYGQHFDTIQENAPLNSLTSEFLYSAPSPFGGENEHYKFRFSPVDFLYEEYSETNPNLVVLSYKTGGDTLRTAQMIAYDFAVYANLWQQWPTRWCDTSGTYCYTYLQP